MDNYVTENGRLNFAYELEHDFLQISDETNTINVSKHLLIEFLNRSDFLKKLALRLVPI